MSLDDDFETQVTNLAEYLQHPDVSEQFARRFLAWRDLSRNQYDYVPQTVEQERDTYLALLMYIFRCLRKGPRIPDPDLVWQTYSGELPVPVCGFVGCRESVEHTH